MTDLEIIKINAHRSNLDRYYKLLQTDLSETERLYVTRRIVEERATLNRLCHEVSLQKTDLGKRLTPTPKAFDHS